MSLFPKDTSWVRQSFLVRAEDLELVDNQNRIFSSAGLKYTDTTPGGNLCINPPPQFTRYADLKARGRFQGNQDGLNGARGMGRYYSEAIDDHSQIIHMRFGVAQFSPLTQFFTSFYNTGAGQLARTGRATNAFYYLGRAAGFIVSVMSWKILAVHLLGVGARFFLQNNSSKFYYLKPAMPLYWSAVTTMVNQLAVNRGIIPRVGEGAAADLAGNPEGNEINIKQLHDLLPDVFKENGGIDVYAMANRAQRLARKQYAMLEQTLKTAGNQTNAQLSKRVQQVYSSTLTDTKPNFTGATKDSGDNNSYLGRWFATSQSQPKESGDGTSGNEEAISSDTADDGFYTFLKSEFDEGGAFASFRVNATGSVSESFSNSVGESDIANKINGMSSSARSTNFSFGNGNLVGGAIGAGLGAVIGGVKDIASGVMDQLNISGLAALGGSAFVDIPKHWQSSQAQLPRASYTINLVSPYGNAMSQLVNLYIPLCMLLAGALPLSTGRQSYTSPFLLELYDQGRCQTRLGMIDSMQITRGTGNLGFSADGHAMGIDVTFSVVDMSSILHMPISQGFSLAAAAVAAGAGGATLATTGSTSAASSVAGGTAAALGGAFDDDSVFTDYMAILGGLGLADQIYQWRKLKLNITRAGAQWDSYLSESHMAALAADTLPGRLIAAFYKGTARDGSQVVVR